MVKINFRDPDAEKMLCDALFTILVLSLRDPDDKNGTPMLKKMHGVFVYIDRAQTQLNLDHNRRFGASHLKIAQSERI